MVGASISLFTTNLCIEVRVTFDLLLHHTVKINPTCKEMLYIFYFLYLQTMLSVRMFGVNMMLLCRGGGAITEQTREGTRIPASCRFVV